MIQDQLMPHLLAGERLIWTGQPAPGHLLKRADLLLIPMSVFFFGFALFWEASVLGLFWAGRGAPGFFPLFGLPFVLVGLYMLVGRFIYKAYAKERTFYGLTDQRALVLSTVWGTRLQSAFIRTIPGISIDPSAGGPEAIGTVAFSDQPPSSFANSGMPAWMLYRSARTEPLAFFDVRDPQAVYSLVGDLRKQN